MTTVPTSTDRERNRARVVKLDEAYAASRDLQSLFAGIDAYRKHMLRAEYESDPAISAEFPNATSFTAYVLNCASRG